MRKRRLLITLRLFAFASAAIVLSPAARAAEKNHAPSELTGTWRGTSVCTDRVAAPACKDETVVYDFTPASAPGTVHWKADKIVDGKREAMGEFDLVYSRSESCWRAEMTTPRFHTVWRVVVDGAKLTGSATLLPGKEVVRRIEARRE